MFFLPLFWVCYMKRDRLLIGKKKLVQIQRLRRCTPLRHVSCLPTWFELVIPGGENYAKQQKRLPIPTDPTACAKRKKHVQRNEVMREERQ